MIILNSVSKEIGKGQFKRLVLDDINWVIPSRCRILILGQRDSGGRILLDILAGMATPTLGWVERRATVSVPGGVLRYSRHDTCRQLIDHLSPLYRVAPADIVKVMSDVMHGPDILDVPTRRLPPLLRLQLNMALTYAFPCDFYLFDGSIVAGPDRKFHDFCRRAFELRSKVAGTIITTTSSKAARRLGEGAMGGVLYRGKLTLYTNVTDALAVFASLPPEVSHMPEQSLLAPQEGQQEPEELF